MSTLLVKLAGPFQAYGTEALEERTTGLWPTKSAIVGLLAAACGISRSSSREAIFELANMPMAVRCDQQGDTFVDDYQVAQNVFKKNKRTNETVVSHRHYLVDCVFIVGVEADKEQLVHLADALDHPYYSLCLGRRSCVPTCRLFAGIYDTPVMDALANFPWAASKWFYEKIRRNRSELFDGQNVRLQVVRDSFVNGTTGNYVYRQVNDMPMSFVPEDRSMGRAHRRRDVVIEEIVVSNPYFQPEHDPLAAVEEAAK